VLNLVPSSRVDAWSRPGNQSSWGGSVIVGSADEPGYHMFAADMTDHCGLNSWQHNSAIRHLVAATPEGPYEQATDSLVLKPFAHNPTVHKAPDGTYIVFHIGDGETGSRPPITNCTNGTTPVAVAGQQRCGGLPRSEIPRAAAQGSLVAPSALFSPTLGGPWTALKSAGGGAGCNNPAAYIFPNGTTLLICKVMTGSPPSDAIRTMQVAVAPSWRGPYTVVRTTEIYGEDAYVWRQPEDGTFHMLLHAMHPTKIPTTAWSPNGLDWTPAFVADLHTPLSATYPSFPHSLAVTGGSTVQLARRERHQLLLNPAGPNTPPGWLFNGVTTPGTADFSFTAVQAIGRDVAGL